MRQIRWFDQDSDDRSGPIDWRTLTITSATLFVNLFFWTQHNVDFCVPGPLIVDGVVVFAASFSIIAMFFLGPACATQALGQSLFGVVERSVGSIPALGLRICGVLYMISFISELVEIPCRWWFWAGVGWTLSPVRSRLIALAVVGFLCATGLQSFSTQARLARFTIKLSLAFLIAALIRVREGWLHALTGFPVSGGCSDPFRFLRGMTAFVSFVGPLAFLAADVGRRTQGRRQVGRICLYGLALPLAVSLLEISFLDLATFASPYYQPSLESNIAMALWGHVQHSYIPGFLMISIITAFGAVRFGIKLLVDHLSLALDKNRRWFVSFGLLGVTALLPIRFDWQRYLLWPTILLAAGAGVITVDFAMPNMRREQFKQFDWIGVAALLGACAIPICVTVFRTTSDLGEYPWLLPGYGVAALICFAGRVARQRRTPGKVQ